MAKINPRYVSTFRAPTEYERQLEEARRRAALAEALAQQEYQPMEGTAAPIPAAAPLVKALQGYMTARAGRQAQEAAEAAKRTEGEYAGRIAGRLGGVQMPQAPETLEKYKPRAADFARGVMARQAETDLNEVTPTSQYRYDPNEALQMASTSVGTAALKDRPILAQRLANLLETPTSEEFGTSVIRTRDGKGVLIGKRGTIKELDIDLADESPEAVTPTIIVKNGKRIVVDARTGREIGAAPETSPLVVNYGQPVAGVDEQGNPVFFQPSKGGGEPAIVPGVRPAPKGMSVEQAKAAGFADRLTEANPIFESGPVGIEANVLSDLPFGAGNFAMTPQQQSFLQAERNFINAVLRRESGAVISPEEFRNARQQYIPQPGDSSQVLEQKKRNRETVRLSLMRDAGPSYKPVSPSAMTGSGWGQAEVVK